MDTMHMKILTDITLPAPFKKIHTGKVRDIFVHPSFPEYMIFISTDRQSAFDRNLGGIPRKGEVLNKISAWWFEQTKQVCPNHFVSAPDPCVSLIKKATMFPIEVIVRGYITGSTNTSLWMNYSQGVRHFCGNDLPEGLKKNQQLEHIIITPTTKSEIHDELTSRDEIIEKEWATEDEWNQIETLAFSLFAAGQELAAKTGLILVDTKYEFGKDAQGNIIVCDEVHTPDSSRFWKESSYQERLSQGKEPESLDKEFLRLWLAKKNFTGHGDIPENGQTAGRVRAERGSVIHPPLPLGGDG